MKAVAIIAGTVATGAIAIVWFPGSWPAYAFGWMVYLMIAIVSTTWYTALLILAVLSIWWVLRQPALPHRRPVPRGSTAASGATGALDAGHGTTRTGED